MSDIREIIPVMLSIKEAVEEFRLPESLIRQLVISKKIVSIQACRRKYYINRSSLIAYLNTGSGVIE